MMIGMQQEARSNRLRAGFDAITVNSESGGRRYAKGGEYLRSSSGAMGEWQVMPATARAPGFGIKPWNGSPDDLARLGKQYQDTMYLRYDGDPAKMWAAYNAGPGALDNAIKKGGADWLKHMPAETQNYVAKNMRQLGGR